MSKYLAPPTERGRRNCVEALERIAERTEQQGVTIGAEPVNRYESNLANTAEQALAVIDDVGAPNLADPVHACGDRLGYVHTGESHRGYLGTGTVDVGELFAALAEIGYDGPLTFESFSSAVTSERFATALTVWRDPWQDGHDLAGQAREFIVAQVSAAVKA